MFHSIVCSYFNKSPFNPIFVAYMSIYWSDCFSSSSYRMSLAPRLIEEYQVPSLVALTAVNFNTTRLIGPAIGGFLIQYFGASQAVLISIFTYMPVMFLFYLSNLEI